MGHKVPTPDRWGLKGFQSGSSKASIFFLYPRVLEPCQGLSAPEKRKGPSTRVLIKELKLEPLPQSAARTQNVEGSRDWKARTGPDSTQKIASDERVLFFKCSLQTDKQIQYNLNQNLYRYFGGTWQVIYMER